MSAQSFGYCDLSMLPDGTVMATSRNFTFSGPSWNISSSIKAGKTYPLAAECTVSKGSASLTMSVAAHERFIYWNPNIASVTVSAGTWASLAANYTVDRGFRSGPGDSLVVYVEGAPPGVDLKCRTPGGSPSSSSANTLKDAASSSGRLMGMAVDDGKLKDPKYSQALTADFNFVTCENCHKWDANERAQGSFDFASGDSLVAFAQANNQTVKLHCLVWGEQLPSWVKSTNDLRAAMLGHIAGVMGHYKGHAKYVDVVNEVIADDSQSPDGLKGTTFYKGLGKAYVEDAFNAAHAAELSAILLANDYGVELLGEKSQRLYDMVKYLVKKGVPVHGVGFQAHFDGTEDLSTLAANMQRFADLGLIILLSELDVQILKFPGPSDDDRLQQQASFYGKVAAACMTQPACKGITMWGLTDANSWLLNLVSQKERPLLLNGDYSKKPAYSSVLNALKSQTSSQTTRRLLQSQGGETLAMYANSPVTVTFYSEPGMDCADGLGQCGFGNRASGPTDFLKKSLYPLHCASGNQEFLGGCGSCGVLHYGGKSRGFTITDVTDVVDSLGPRDWPPNGAHIDLCCDQFDYFQSLDHGNGIDCDNGGIFTGMWTRVPCETMGYPNFPGDGVVVRTMAWNPFAKALFVARLPGVGEVRMVDFKTRNGGNYPGQKVQGWGSWFTPGQDLSGQGGIGIRVTMVDETVYDWTDSYPLPDFLILRDGDVYMLQLPIH